MLAAALQTLFNLSAIFTFAFMIACTVFIVVCAIRGDIKVDIVRDEAKKENE